jgi:peptidoglycan/LPS O-acetylase OafA/YrhL
MTITELGSKEHLNSLTGLRFFAAFFVYLNHHPGPAFLPSWLTTFFTSGYNAVTIFFVLSGFVIGLNYFDSISKPSRGELVRCFAARFARVYPLYLVVVLYVWLLSGAPHDSNLIAHLLAIQTWSPNLGIAYGYVSPGWSISVEFFFYASFPLIAIVLSCAQGRERVLWSLAAAVTVSLFLLALYFVLVGRGGLAWEDPDSAHRWLYRTPATRLGDFALGVIGALLYRQNGTIKPRSKRIWSIITKRVSLRLWRGDSQSLTFAGVWWFLCASRIGIDNQVADARYGRSYNFLTKWASTELRRYTVSSDERLGCTKD